MTKWRVEKEQKGMFSWKAVSPHNLGYGTTRTVSFAQAIKQIYELTKEERQAMTKTLADMTAVERAQCRGMWCDFPDPDERTNLAIYVGDSLKHHGFCELVHEGQLGTLTIPETLTPRFDLPRAWTPDGEPVPLVREYGNGGWEEDLGEPYHWPIRSSACNEYCSPFDNVPAEYSRWVSKWEPALKAEPKREPVKTNGMVNPYV